MPDNKVFTHDVFLSHNSEDKEAVRKIANELKSRGLRVWFDEWEIKHGEDIYLKIEEGLETSRNLLLCMSSNCFKSDWVSLELSTVIFRDPVNRNRRFIPLLLESCTIPDSLKRFKYIDYRKRESQVLSEFVASQKTDADSTVSKSKDSYPKEIQGIIKEAKEAKRNGCFKESREKWSLVDDFATKKDNLKLSIRARIETAVINVTDGHGSIDNALEIVDGCLTHLQETNLENELGEILHLLGEFYRLKKDFEKAKSYLVASSEEALANEDLHAYGWDALSLAMLELDTRQSFEVQFKWTEKAYNAFSKIEISGKENAKKDANLGYANCHIVRAKCYGYSRPDEALAEYSKAVKIYEQLGESWKFDKAVVLLERGGLQASNKDAQQALSDLVEAGLIFSNLDNYWHQAKAGLAIAELFDGIGQRVKSREYYQSAFAISMRIEDESKSVLYQMRFAMKLLELQEVDKAKALLNDLLNKKWISDGQKMDVLQRLSDTVRHPENDKEELKSYQLQVLEIIDQKLLSADTPNERLSLLIDKGSALTAQERYESSIDTYERSIKLAKSISAGDRIVDCWAHIAKVHAQNNQPDNEKRAYEKVIELSDEYGKSMQTYTAHLSLSQILMKDRKFELAEEHLNLAENGMKKILPPLMFIINDVRERLEKMRDEEKNR